MRVVIENAVHTAISEFYAVSMMLHPSLDRRSVLSKMERLYASARLIGRMPKAYPYARLKQSWIDAGYREMIAEDFNFAFRVEADQYGNDIVVVYDACHSLLYTE